MADDGKQATMVYLPRWQREILEKRAVANETSLSFEIRQALAVALRPKS